MRSGLQETQGSALFSPSSPNARLHATIHRTDGCVGSGGRSGAEPVEGGRGPASGFLQQEAVTSGGKVLDRRERVPGYQAGSISLPGLCTGSALYCPNRPSGPRVAGQS